MKVLITSCQGQFHLWSGPFLPPGRAHMAVHQARHLFLSEFSCSLRDSTVSFGGTRWEITTWRLILKTLYRLLLEMVIITRRMYDGHGGEWAPGVELCLVRWTYFCWNRRAALPITHSSSSTCSNLTDTPAPDLWFTFPCRAQLQMQLTCDVSPESPAPCTSRALRGS